MEQDTLNLNDTESLRDLSIKQDSLMKDSEEQLGKDGILLQNDQSKQEKKQKRSIFTDWMRSIAIYLVVFTHINVALGRTIHESTLNPSLREARQSFFRTVLQFGMPIFFYFSGRSAYFSKDKFIIWAYKKTTRLILPLIFGTIFIVIPTQYIALPYGDSEVKGENLSFWEYFPLFFTKDFPSNGFEWLWFLPVLYGCSLISYPYIQLAKRLYHSEPGENKLNKWNIIYFVSYVVVANLMSVIGCLILEWRYYGFIMISLAFQILVLVNLYFIDFYRKLKLLEAIYVPIFLCPLFLAGTQKYFTDDYKGMSNQISMFVYLEVFYIAGLIDEITYVEYCEFKQRFEHLRKKPFFLFFFLILFCICMPGININVGYLYSYPIYQNVMTKVFYVMGTWFWIFFLVRWCQQFFDDYLDKKQYQFLMESCMVTYLVHWLFLEIGNRYFIYTHNIDYGVALIILFFWTFFCCMATYMICKKVPYVGLFLGLAEDGKTGSFKKKKKSQDSSQELQNPLIIEPQN